MDELLMARVKQLREIEERLERIEQEPNYLGRSKALSQLRRDVEDMIRAAIAEHDAF